MFSVCLLFTTDPKYFTIQMFGIYSIYIYIIYLFLKWYLYRIFERKRTNTSTMV